MSILGCKTAQIPVKNNFLITCSCIYQTLTIHTWVSACPPQKLCAHLTDCAITKFVGYLSNLIKSPGGKIIMYKQ